MDGGRERRARTEFAQRSCRFAPDVVGQQGATELMAGCEVPTANCQLPTANYCGQPIFEVPTATSSIQTSRAASVW
jgi:hypothetical protein